MSATMSSKTGGGPRTDWPSFAIMVANSDTILSFVVICDRTALVSTGFAFSAMRKILIHSRLFSLRTFSMSDTKSSADMRYSLSQRMLKRAEAVIPLGSQTFSKSYLQYPRGHAPFFVSHAKGGRVWDVDGNEYVDMVMGLLPVVLGHCDPDVDAAIQNQMLSGISHSLATEREIELAELLVKLIPCAEMVRFGKNGSDVTSAAVRIARAYTGRDRIAAGGYHGFQDWYIGATERNLGVPVAVRELTHRFPFLDIEALEKILDTHKGEFAAVIMETVGFTEPTTQLLKDFRELTHKHGALLIFDEIITGFRVDLGGAQEHYGVVPDLATFGKSMANGMPISAVVGRRDIMKQMELVFFSSTFGGETLSIAAALATISKMRKEDVIEILRSSGRWLQHQVKTAINNFGLDDHIKVGGHPAWTLLSIPDPAVKTLFLIKMLKRGVLTTGSHNVCFAHDDSDLRFVQNACYHSLRKVADAVRCNDVEERLGCEPLRPVFAVRTPAPP
jgi:glutamate-1-semialdehyde 2,1-aminomutase